MDIWQFLFSINQFSISKNIEIFSLGNNLKKTNSPGINFKRNTKIFSSGSNLKKEIFTWYQFKKISQYFHLVINWRKKIFTWYQFEKNIKIFSPGNKKLSVWRLPLRCCTQFLTLDLKKTVIKKFLTWRLLLFASSYKILRVQTPFWKKIV